MFLELAHTKLIAYDYAKKLVSECYITLKKFPPEEKYCLTQQIKRAAHSVLLNIAEGASRKSEAERKRYFEIARGSVIEVDSGFSGGEILGYVTKENETELGIAIVKSFKLLTGLIDASKKN